MKNPTLLSLLLAVSACGVDGTDLDVGDDSVGPMDPIPSAELRITPSKIDATINNEAAVRQDLRATLVKPDGTELDVTDDVTFALADSRYGSIHGSELTLTGGGAGPTVLTAKLGTATGSAPVTVYVQGSRNLGAPADSKLWFDNATSVGGCAPSLVYPEPGTLIPANLGALDVHWTDVQSDLFRVRVHGFYVDYTYFIAGTNTGKNWMTVEADWSKFASARMPVTIEVSGTSASNPVTKCIGSSRYIDVTKDDAKGGVYYWSTDWMQRAAGLSGQDIMRFDMQKPEVAPSPLFTDANRPAACVGCHAVSRDGTKIAMTMGGATGQGSVIDLASNHEMMPSGSSGQRWSQAVFNHDGNKLLAVEAGKMRLMTATGQPLATLPNTPGYTAGNPEISPDGTKLVNVESSGEDDWAFGNASIVVRSFNNESNTFGPASMLLPFDTTDGVQSYYPSWSPDGEWLAVTRSPNGSSFANPDASIWIIKADGSIPAIELPSTHGTMDSYARWMPSANKLTDEPVFFLSFSSTRSFGVRAPDGGLPQIWLTPFYPQRATAGRDPSGPAYRAPFQSLTSSNHNAQWATSVVAPQN
jgi:hypothetical protein